MDDNVLAENQTRMKRATLRKLADGFLVPLFSGARLLRNSEPSTTAAQLVSFTDPQTIAFRVGRGDSYRLLMRRAQPFDSTTSGRLTEKDVVEAFVSSVRAISGGLSKTYSDDLLANLQRHVVARSVLPGQPATLLAAIDQLDQWSKRLYEGAPIVAGFGLTTSTSARGGSIEAVSKEKLAQVLSDGFDTILTFDSRGFHLGYEVLNVSARATFAPYRYGGVAEWAQRGNVAVTLNRLGEILVFLGGRLVFARRSGRWHFLTHEPVVTQMKRPQGKAVRQAVYESTLDASFARMGACIGVVTPPHRANWKLVAPNADDHLEMSSNLKATTLKTIVRGRKFQDIERELRQELLAIDGATILSSDGDVLAIGTILNVTGTVGTGGREAAAIALSTMGLGIKVSQDGAIRGYHDGNSDPIFVLM